MGKDWREVLVVVERSKRRHPRVLDCIDYHPTDRNGHGLFHGNWLIIIFIIIPRFPFFSRLSQCIFKIYTKHFHDCLRRSALPFDILPRSAPLVFKTLSGSIFTDYAIYFKTPALSDSRVNDLHWELPATPDWGFVGPRPITFLTRPVYSAGLLALVLTIDDLLLRFSLVILIRTPIDEFVARASVWDSLVENGL